MVAWRGTPQLFEDGRGIEQVELVGVVAATDIDMLGFAYFKVQVSGIMVIGSAVGANDLSARDQCLQRHMHPVKVRIHGMQKTPIQGAVCNDEDITPCRGGLTGVYDQAIPNRINGITQIGIHAADAIEIITRMVAAALLIHLPECLGLVGEVPHGGVESGCERDLCHLPSRREFKAMVDNTVLRHQQRWIRALKADAFDLGQILVLAV